MTLINIKQEIEEGRFDIVRNFRNRKVFGRRIFIKFNEAILLANLQYTIDRLRQKIIIFAEFAKDRKTKSSKYNLIIKEYTFEQGMDLDIYVSRIREDLIQEIPQSKEFIWSFNARKLLE